MRVKKFIPIIVLAFVSIVISIGMLIWLNRDYYPKVDVDDISVYPPKNVRDLDFSFICYATYPQVMFPEGSIIETKEIISIYDWSSRFGEENKDNYGCFITVKIPDKYGENFKKHLYDNCLKENYFEQSLETAENRNFGKTVYYRVGDYYQYCFDNPIAPEFISRIEYCESDDGLYAYVLIGYKID